MVSRCPYGYTCIVCLSAYVCECVHVYCYVCMFVCMSVYVYVYVHAARVCLLGGVGIGAMCILCIYKGIVGTVCVCVRAYVRVRE